MILQVLGGTLNVGSGVLTVRCSAVAADSAVAKVATLVEQVSRQNQMELHHCSECAQGICQLCCVYVVGCGSTVQV